MQVLEIETKSAALANSTYRLTFSLYELAESASLAASALVQFVSSPERYDDESIWNYGQRLAAFRLLDDPAIRWRYQQAVLSAPFRAIRRWWGHRG